MNKNLYEACSYFHQKFCEDCSFTERLCKSFIAAYLVQTANLSSFLEIGGNDLAFTLSVAYSITQNSGVSHRIVCPNTNNITNKKQTGRTSSLTTEPEELINPSESYSNNLRESLVSADSTIIRLMDGSYSDVMRYLERDRLSLDLVHYSGAEDIDLDASIYESIYQLAREGAYILLSNIQLPGINDFYLKVSDQCESVIQDTSFMLLRKCSQSKNFYSTTTRVGKRVNGTLRRLRKRAQRSELKPLIVIGVLTFNHEPYVQESIRSIASQLGDFRFKVIICDDKSSDNTVEIIRAEIAQGMLPNNFEWEIHVSSDNLGMRGNFMALINRIKATDCDYFSFCEGDDYYLSESRILRHFSECERCPEIAVSYNRFSVYRQSQKDYVCGSHKQTSKRSLTADLVTENYIGNANTSFISGEILDYITEDFFKPEIGGDWIFHLFCSQYGDINRVNYILNIYRAHSKGFWSGKSQIEQCRMVLSELPSYNEVMECLYENEFLAVKDAMDSILDANKAPRTSNHRNATKSQEAAARQISESANIAVLRQMLISQRELISRMTIYISSLIDSSRMS